MEKAAKDFNTRDVDSQDFDLCIRSRDGFISLHLRQLLLRLLQWSLSLIQKCVSLLGLNL